MRSFLFVSIQKNPRSSFFLTKSSLETRNILQKP